MGWLGNQRQDVEILDLVLDVMCQVDTRVHTRTYELVTRRHGHTTRIPQLVHETLGIRVCRPAPGILNTGPHEVVLKNHRIVPSLAWRRRFSKAFAERERLIAARDLAGSLRDVEAACASSVLDTIPHGMRMRRPKHSTPRDQLK
jgi:hypothetical protein